MKPLKIKAWLEIGKRWATADELLSDVPVSASVRNKVLTIGSDPWEIVVCAGLTDKSGDDIFNGDIIDGSYINPMTGEVTKRHYLVVFKEGTFYAELIGKHPFGTTWLSFVNKKGKVIGNKYENPELLA